MGYGSDFHLPWLHTIWNNLSGWGPAHFLSPLPALTWSWTVNLHSAHPGGSERLQFISTHTQSGIIFQRLSEIFNFPFSLDRPIPLPVHTSLNTQCLLHKHSKNQFTLETRMMLELGQDCVRAHTFRSVLAPIAYKVVCKNWRLREAVSSTDCFRLTLTHKGTGCQLKVTSLLASSTSFYGLELPQKLMTSTLRYFPFYLSK